MKTCLLLFIFFFIIANETLLAQHVNYAPKRCFGTDSVYINKKHAWRAAYETFGFNVGLWAADRYIGQAGFAKISWNSIKNNFKIGPVWDLDNFPVNLFSHPYTGGLYFNAARSSGLNFWQSAPYSLGGSLMWEFFGEKELPSINDMIATTLGGISIGEVSYRTSDLIINEKSIGTERVTREIAAAIISPIRFLNRLIEGRVTRVAPCKGKELPKVNLSLTANAGIDIMYPKKESSGKMIPTIKIGLEYGESNTNETLSPYEWFQMRLGLQAISSQPFIGHFNTIGVIWSTNIVDKSDVLVNWGVYQHSDYYNSGMMSNTPNTHPPYRVFSTGIGLGATSTVALCGEKLKISSELYLNGDPLGASVSDHFNFINRDYNMGSGYNAEFFFNINYAHKIIASLYTEFYHLFTWKGYNLTDVSEGLLDGKLNSQGDIGNARHIIAGGKLLYAPFKRWNVTFEAKTISRYTYYKYHPNVSSDVFRTSLTLGYYLFSE